MRCDVTEICLSLIGPTAPYRQARVCRGQRCSMTDLSSERSSGVDPQRLLIAVIRKNVLYDGEDDRHRQITPDKQTGEERRGARRAESIY